ncbi:ribonuclease P protein subunit p14-like [Penaeus chinensis]|uniref:ribonuclease P protein subunit p14-like n=1 Tax=Penaeus chinensis TaxID=139456 RepID=UPI001FB5D570|nr:ribonuclease P protein subunit p14-like [Penaeus chinensis]XP_047489616.1 ribonuclease P protein subunit p14-like [Penaeus chinensis]XP_047489617.1 ribonuclease P protein subunit p14-like [Penaeus chinensis]
MKQLEPKYWYLRVHMDYEREYLPFPLTAELVKVVIVGAIDIMFGELSSCLPLDVLKFNEKTGIVILRVPKDNYSKVRAALTVCPSMRVGRVDVPVIYTTQQASSCLLSLAGPERSII